MSFSLPLVEEISPHWTPEAVFVRLVGLPHCVFLDSAMPHPYLGRYSFLAADPFEYLEVPADGPDALEELALRLKAWTTPPLPGLPPFQGGAVGIWGYELVRQWERLPQTRWDEFQVPVLAVGLYDVVVAFDHQEGRAWIISQGFPYQEPIQRRHQARQRLHQWKTLLSAPPVASESLWTQGERPGEPGRRVKPAEGDVLNEARLSGNGADSCSGVPRQFRFRFASAEYPEGPVFQERKPPALENPLTGGARSPGVLLLPGRLAPQYSVAGMGLLTSNFTPAGYQEAVRRVKEYIAAGDVFQVNLAQRFLLPVGEPAWKVYLRLRSAHPAPFAGYFDLGDFQVLSASPERFLWVGQGQVETRPIKGTRPRTGCPQKDQATQEELLRSVKDRAENVMIVDLLRNDLSRVCRPESIRVSQLCGLETYARVFHLVSAVRGQLRSGCSGVDVVRACFPGGSVTGAPKVRAMEIIAELEPTARGAYCGSLGYIGFDGNMDLNLLIRTITVGRGWLQLHVGGGITILSDPQQEYQETWDKAQGLLQAMLGTAENEPLCPPVPSETREAAKLGNSFWSPDGGVMQPHPPE